MLSGNDLNLFHMDKESGKIKVSGPLARFSGQEFKLVIEAYDNFGVHPTNISPSRAHVRVMIDQGTNSVVLSIQSPTAQVTKNMDELLR